MQAYRDFCASEGDAAKVYPWIGTPSFSCACAATGIDEERAIDTFKSLARFDFPMRSQLMRETVVATVGGFSKTKAR